MYDSDTPSIFFSSEKHFQRMNRLLQVGSLDVAWSYGSVKNIQTNLFRLRVLCGIQVREMKVV